MDNDKHKGLTLSTTEASRDDRPLLRFALFTSLGLTLLGIFWRPLYMLAELSFRLDPFSHTILIPLVSATFLCWQRKNIFAKVKFDLPSGGLLFFIASVLCWFGSNSARVPTAWNGLSLSVLSLVVFLVGSFVLCYGFQAARAAAFPLLFLLLMVPIPEFALNKIIHSLQYGTADCVGVIFNVLGISVHRDGLLFDLPGVSILVAQECSGIRSSIALFIFALLAAQLSLKSNWRKLILCVLLVPIAVAKNSVRIVTLSLLAVYVDRGFLSGHLHQEGGVIFFLIGLAVLIGFLRLLEMSERSPHSGQALSEKVLAERAVVSSRMS